MTTPDDPLIGRVLERRYRIDAPIARGGMSAVYVGTDLRLHRRVAVKVMDARYVGDSQFLRRFEFEARAVAGLSHPGLVAVYDQSIDGEIAFLVMELVRGGSIRELLRERGPMPPHAVTAVAVPMLGGLGTAHRAGLVHRDVKPENVLISDSGDIKVADFGLVRAVAEAGVTSASVILGTAAYLSPEQVSSTDIDARSDVYSAGVLLFELLTGRQPFSGSTQLALAYQRLSYDVPAPGDVIEGVPPMLDDIVLRATERDPADRFRDGFAMQHAILDAADELGLPAFTVPAPSQASARVTSAIARPVRPTPVGGPGYDAGDDGDAGYGDVEADYGDHGYGDHGYGDAGYGDYGDYRDRDYGNGAHGAHDREGYREYDDDYVAPRTRYGARAALIDDHRNTGRRSGDRAVDDLDEPVAGSRRLAAVIWFVVMLAVAAGLGAAGWALGSALT